jgi:Niemann-Pick C1 protein
MTMISCEVAPFLILAIGVDNMFIIYNSFKRQNETKGVNIRLCLAIQEVGPSITAATVCEFFALLSNF